jgi:hypothetical protein
VAASLFVIVLVVVLVLCSFSSVSHAIALGASLSTTSTTTLNQVTSLNNKGLALLSVGLANYTQAITFGYGES